MSGATTNGSSAPARPRVRVLMVCLGNICRSPMAEALLRHKLRGRVDLAHVDVDSAGTGAWHAGEEPDPRTRETLRAHGIAEWSRARQFAAPADFDAFDHVVAMDEDNVATLLRMPGARRDKVSLATSWVAGGEGPVADPYYGTISDFEAIFRQLDGITDAMLVALSAKR